MGARRLLGALLVLGGLALSGWLGWQLLVTDWLAERRHADTVAELERTWAAGGGSGGDRRVVGARDGAEPEPGAATAVLRVPAFGPDWAVPVVEGTTDEVLTRGVGRFASAAAAGARGNYALAGHRITHGEPFARLPELEPGDEVVVETADAVHTYVLDTDPEDLRVTFEAGWVTASRPRNPDPGGVGPSAHRQLITLTTCAELFRTDDRLVAFGHLVSTEHKPA